jgi:hypothetical protein
MGGRGETGAEVSWEEGTKWVELCVAVGEADGFDMRLLVCPAETVSPRITSNIRPLDAGRGVLGVPRGAT